MKMKKVTLGFSIVALAASILTSCKKTPNEVPEPDTEVQSALDATWATYVITDLEQMCAFMGENQSLSHFYIPVPSATVTGATGTMTATRDTVDKNLNLAYFKTNCADGRFREGTVFLRYKPDPLYSPNANPNSNYYREFGFVGRMTMSEYKIDGWKVEMVDGAPCLLINKMSSREYDPATEQLKWQIKGKFLFTHPTDASKNMVVECDLLKTLTNSTDPKVFKATKDHKADGAITWTEGVVSYSGTVTGTMPRTQNGTTSTVNFTLAVGPNDNALVRDFTCYSDMVGGVALTNTAGVLAVRKKEYHPFVKGIASFIPGTSYPRQIYFGNEGDVNLTSQCDNSGEILIKGISYRVDFIEGR